MVERTLKWLPQRCILNSNCDPRILIVIIANIRDIVQLFVLKTTVAINSFIVLAN